jgi:hypothetical protein
MHELGSLTFSGCTSPHLRVSGFFLLCSVGATLELLFRRVTGKRVRGPLGFVWCWTWVAVAGWGLVRTWLEWGLGGHRLIPDGLSVAHQVGDRFVAPWLVENGWVYRGK